VLAFLILEKRKTDLRKKTFQKNLQELDYHVERAIIAGGSQVDHCERNGKS
jgi:hypothetical protein